MIIFSSCNDKNIDDRRCYFSLSGVVYLQKTIIKEFELAIFFSKFLDYISFSRITLKRYQNVLRPFNKYIYIYEVVVSCIMHSTF